MIYLILGVALALRLIALNQSLWLDEATSAMVAKMSIADMFTRFLPADFHPPLYYIDLKYWVMLIGSSEVALRVPSIIFGLATVYVVYRMLSFLSPKSRFVPAAASILLATSGLAVYYSQEARMYSLAAFLVTLVVYLVIQKRWFLLAIIMGLLGMTDYLSLLIIPVLFLIDFKNWKKIAASLSILFVSFLFWLPIFLKQLSAGFAQEGGAWWGILGTVSIKNIALISVKFMLGRISFDDKTVYAVVVALVSALFIFLLVKAKAAPKAFWLWLVVPLVLGIGVSFKIPTLTYFRYLFCLPALYILTAYGLSKAGKFRGALFGLVLLVNLLSSFYYLLTPKYHREDWRAAAQAIGGDKIVLPGDSQKEALIYYGKGSQIVKVNDVGPQDDNIWLSRYVWEIVDPKDTTRLKLEALGYNMASEQNFNGVVFYRYTKNIYAYSN